MDCSIFPWRSSTGFAVRPNRCFAQRRAAGTVCQRPARQVGSGLDFARPLDRLGLLGEGIEVEIGGKTA